MGYISGNLNCRFTSRVWTLHPEPLFYLSNIWVFFILAKFCAVNISELFCFRKQFYNILTFNVIYHVLSKRGLQSLFWFWSFTCFGSSGGCETLTLAHCNCSAQLLKFLSPFFEWPIFSILYMLFHAVLHSRAFSWFS